MTDSLRDSFRTQARACEALGSAFTARLLRLLADALMPDGAVSRRVLDWPGDPTGRGDALALRLAGGLHLLARSGQDPDLAAVYADPPDNDAALLAPVLAALARHEGTLMAALDHAPQTNEVRRSAALIAAGHWLQARLGLPMVLSELGTSAGLNLIWDHHALIAGGRRLGPDDAPVTLTPRWTGPLPPLAPPVIAARAGVDLNPLDPVRDRARILSYIWADQTDRLTRTEAALDLAAQMRPAIAKGDAIDWLEARRCT